MNTIVNEISLDFNENRSLKVVRLKQNDTALRHIRLTLTHNGVAVQLDTNEEEAKVSVSVNGVAVVIGNSCAISNNKIEFDVTQEMTALSGEGICDVRITKNGYTIYTASFRLLIEPSAVSADTPEIVPTTDFVKNFAEQTQLDWTAYIINAFEGMHPEYDKTIITQTVEEMSSFTSDTPFYIISSSVFTSDVDGLFICLNDKLILRSDYSFDHTIPNTTRIYFDATKVSFSVGDTVKFFIYKKPSGSSGIIGAAYPSISSMSTDSVSGLVEE
jgi:hypothetical protein